MLKKKKTFVKPVINDNTPNTPLNFNIKKNIEDSKKIKPQNVFEGYKKPKSKSKK
jgi:hypothetical protein|tara:strand:+ start:716 stop:880 length:165 start_codon:yes stop_codon:yes gene_type:complete